MKPKQPKWKKVLLWTSLSFLALVLLIVIFGPDPDNDKARSNFQYAIFRSDISRDFADFRVRVDTLPDKSTAIHIARKIVTDSLDTDINAIVWFYRAPKDVNKKLFNLDADGRVSFHKGDLAPSYDILTVPNETYRLSKTFRASNLSDQKMVAAWVNMGNKFCIYNIDSEKVLRVLLTGNEDYSILDTLRSDPTNKPDDLRFYITKSIDSGGVFHVNKTENTVVYFSNDGTSMFRYELLPLTPL